MQPHLSAFSKQRGSSDSLLAGAPAATWEMLVLRVTRRHGRPRLQEQHQELEVVPPPRGFQQLQEEGESLLLSLHVLYLDLGGRRGG